MHNKHCSENIQCLKVDYLKLLSMYDIDSKVQSKSNTVQKQEHI